MVETIINHPIFDGLYHPFMVILGMVYYCFNHIIAGIASFFMVSYNPQQITPVVFSGMSSKKWTPFIIYINIFPICSDFFLLFFMVKTIKDPASLAATPCRMWPNLGCGKSYGMWEYHIFLATFTTFMVLLWSYYVPIMFLSCSYGIWEYHIYYSYITITKTTCIDIFLSYPRRFNYCSDLKGVDCPIPWY